MKRYSHLDYRLTQKVRLHGCSCKLSKQDLEGLLSSSGLEVYADPRVLAGVGEDAGITKISDGKVVVQHLDFFTPIIDDPYIQGEIAACNSASDVFSKGATDLIGALMIMGIPADTPDEVLHGIVRGFRDLCSSLPTPIVGGQSIYCPWPIIGGAVSGIAKTDQVIYSSNAKPEDVLILTKPLGIQPIMAALRLSPNGQKRVVKGISEAEVSGAIDKAIDLMITSNRRAAEAMVEVGVNAATDITGFGILGHSNIMAKRSEVDIVIHTLPVIRGSLEVSEALGYKLGKGKTAETSGGLLISVQKGGAADSLVSSLNRRKVPAYEVGFVKEGSGRAYMVKEPKFLEV